MNVKTTINYYKYDYFNIHKYDPFAENALILNSSVRSYCLNRTPKTSALKRYRNIIKDNMCNKQDISD
jgi:hypothetical protein